MFHSKYITFSFEQDTFDDNKEVIRSRKSKKDIQHNGQTISYDTLHIEI